MGFSAEWLTLREPVDHASRAGAVTDAAIAALRRGTRTHILDLAAGTGSNLRYLSSRIGAADWLLVDHDRALLARVLAAPDVETRCLDLASLDDRPIFDGRALVTASALLDLVSEPWVRSLAARCAEAGAAVLFVLNYDGRIECSPADADDELIVGLVNAHQRTDKGFGPALGPDATGCAARSFEALGYHVTRGRSDWVLAPALHELQRQLIDGWAGAAAEVSPGLATNIGAWRARRIAHVDAHRSTITVGHEDLAAWLRSRV
jgi:hypothetical protein